MTYRDMQRRLAALEAQTTPRRAWGRHVVVDFIAEAPATPEDEAQRLAAAHEEAGPHGLVIVWCEQDA